MHRHVLGGAPIDPVRNLLRVRRLLTAVVVRHDGSEVGADPLCHFHHLRIARLQVVLHVAVERGRIGAGQHGMHPDVEVTALHGQCLGEALNGPLRRAVGGLQRDADHAGHRGDIDHHTPALLSHDGHHRPGGVEHAKDIGVEHGAHGRIAGLLQRGMAAVARVVDQHIDAAEPFQGFGDGVSNAGLIGHVQAGDQRAFQVGQIACVFRPAHGGGDVPPVGLKGLGRQTANAGGTAGDQRCLSHYLEPPIDAATAAASE